jgi:aminoglycoside phosphotransferase (APT) family kinase protein
MNGAVPSALISRLARTVSPRRVTRAERLSGGLSNSGFKIQLEGSDEPIVLRIYDRDRAACRKELDVLRLVRATVPVPDVIHAEPTGLEAGRPFAFLKYVHGMTFRELKATRDERAIQQASYAVGATLAAIGRHSLDSPEVKHDAERISESIDASLGSPLLIDRIGVRLAAKVHALASTWTARLSELGRERRLVHGDFRKQNVLVHRVGQEWRVAVILDWECAGCGSPLSDVGVFLRYEQPARPVAEPHFSRGFAEAGGHLDVRWSQLIRVVDLKGLCRILAAQELPPAIAREVKGLVAATVAEVGQP